ncbi:lipase [Pseudozyma hubeiensis SY62]|uniref:Lipase n=1 Tax=Pseudozyma hubeiensis (strain SY62) TaxID=1305764 RepID=R9PE37_PSEHS|nr:lipase [Pseudozyma hubeiensis SY62]GAC99517.1 lipase [Pseudozyma hubeiensis SY62]
MPSIWSFAGPSEQAGPSADCQDENHPPSPSSSTIPPLIICEGFLSAAQSVVWGNEFRTYLGVGHQQLVDSVILPSSSPQPRRRRSGLGSSRPVIFAPIGPVSSLHDRACELFYALRGGTVDYGHTHSLTHGHSRYGRHYHSPLCPSWGSSSPDSAFLPAHFLGHSLGGPTILKLQQLLRQGFFDHALPNIPTGYSPADLILSITSVSSPFRGTPLVYSLGSEPLPYPKVRMFSFGDMLSKFIHIAAWLDLPFFDAHADAWHFSRRKSIGQREMAPGGVIPGEVEGVGEEEKRKIAGVRGILRQLWKSDWAGGRDCAPWDCTFAERDQDRSSQGWGLEEPNKKRLGKTWYRSYAGGMTVADSKDEGPKFHRPETYWSLSPLTYTSHLIGHFDYGKLQPVPSFMHEGEKGGAGVEGLHSSWWENDGVVPLASQYHPFGCKVGECRHFKGMPASLPWGKRRKRPQSMMQSSTAAMAGLVSTPLTSTADETDTLVDVSVEKVDTSGQESEGPLLPLPATQPIASNRSMFGTARSAARIAYFTSLRAINVHDPPLITPSDEELRSFLPDLTPATETLISPQSPSSTPDRPADRIWAEQIALQRHLIDPIDNQWYTFKIDNLDHTSLCPFWTGSEVQKQFWTGMGLFLASVDRKVGFTVEDEDDGDDR